MNISVKRLRELSVAVNALSKHKGEDDLANVANSLANIYSDIFGFDCVLKVSRREACHTVTCK
jgi:hypothetical protein